MLLTATDISYLLFSRLWELYLDRVSYAKKYAELVTQKGGIVVNDHIAFRTFKTHTGEQPEGIRAIKHILNIFGYKPAAQYAFQKKKLNAVHFEHPDEMFPKIFVSQLEVEELPGWAQLIIKNTVKETPYLLSDASIELMQILKAKGTLNSEAAEILLSDLTQYFRRPWKIPIKEEVLQLNDVSQYAAWTLLHGNSVNHFTAYINFQNVPEWPDIEATSRGLELEGIPMKQLIEGNKGSKLRQTATLAVKEEVDVIGEDGPEKINWTYAYYELAERGFIETGGNKKLFSGFLGEQATHLFDMTKTREY